MNEIKIFNNFLSSEECEFYINYIDNNLHKFLKTPTTKRYGLLFGKDLAHKEKSKESLDEILDIRDDVVSLFRKVEDVVKDSSESKDQLYVCSFFLAKQVDGSRVTLHYDTDNDTNMHFRYGGVIYLNTMKVAGSGILNFPFLNYSYTPVAGDFVIFPSHGQEYAHEVTTILEDRYSLPVWVTDNPEWKIA